MARFKANSVDEYISTFPKETQKAMEQVRFTIKKVIPKADEVISYAIPCFKLDGAYVIYFAGFEHHIGVYPAPVNEESFKKEFSKYKTGKGSIQFPLDKPMPLALITKITKYRLKASLEKVASKALATKTKKVASKVSVAKKKKAVSRNSAAKTVKGK